MMMMMYDMSVPVPFCQSTSSCVHYVCVENDVTVLSYSTCWGRGVIVLGTITLDFHIGFDPDYECH